MIEGGYIIGIGENICAERGPGTRGNTNGVGNLMVFTLQQSILVTLVVCTGKKGAQIVAEEMWNHLETERKVSIMS